ncbi:NAD(+)/NADH kinase [Heliorestis convoluta]|uniref:NAD kinase n=1 Tax=Heliorestis convoluta TaxID=356322 RepID=A0A5Q2MW62_9FIRM|nr:NAD(+)/NADH kinase [Heliorestis convoluta]QGG46538.1 putative inorganic polyphosphate/ATP-NAD kinase [Heliorestis convoluta]
MTAIGVILNEEKPQAHEVARKMAQWLSARGISMGIPLTNVTELVKSTSKELSANLQKLDYVIVLGGDGTLLNTARLVAPFKVPLLGVNLGRLGFLTEIEEADLFFALEKIIEGDYSIEERMMLEAYILNEEGASPIFYALNDMVVTKGANPRMLRMDASIDDEVVASYSADGLIVASPTGSTAYSMSAGGPILSPDLQALIMTPICPHSLDARPLVISKEKVIRITVRSPYVDGLVTVDGQPGRPLRWGESVLIRKASVSCRLLKIKNRSFFHILHEKMQQGRA